MNDADRHLLTIFSTALGRDPAGERAAYLDEACAAAPGLRDRVEALLRAHDQPGRFLEPGDAATADASQRPPAPAADPTDVYAAPLDGVGATIGPYRLLQVIGEGGMGTVYMAEQTHPVRRLVALKIIKAGMDTGQVVARFEAERQALAMMDHPSIAKVFDAGATAAGRPYFVMELVKGVPITEYCDAVHLTPKERLELFIPVCAAVQHAHQKGIIHRDIKPSNVLVAMQDGKPVPKVIDFGIAKATEQKLTERSLFTQHGAVVGTLEYMSPEQAEMSAMGVDTRTDVYALGVLLYELLTGTTPLGRERLRDAGYAEILRRIKDEEPPKPSTRLSESRESLSSVAAQRRMEPARLTKLVRGDLDWIVMKSIEKDRVRRYETANGFARDIQRYLDGDAVEACPPSARYKLGKFARKYRAALATAGAFAFLLVTATAISVGLALLADRERGRAVRAETAAKVQQGRAQEREKVAIDAVKRFRDAIANEPELRNAPALDGLRKRLLKEPLSFFRTLRDRLQADRDTRPESLERMAQASFELGGTTSEIGDKEDALAAYREALAIRQRLVDADPTVTASLAGLPRCYNRLGRALDETGKPAEAVGAYETALSILKKLAEADPSVTEYRSQLAANYSNLAVVLGMTGKRAEALEADKSALTIRTKLAADNPDVAQFQHELASSHNNIGVMLAKDSNVIPALQSYKAALRIFEKLVESNPSSTRYRSDLGRAHANIGAIQSALGRLDEAQASSEASIKIRQELVAGSPTATQFNDELADGLLESCKLLIVTRKPIEALRASEAAHAMFRKLADANPTVIGFRADLAGCDNATGNALRILGKTDEAMKSYESALAIYQELAAANPSITSIEAGRAGTYFNIGLLLTDANRPAEAIKAYRSALAIQKELASTNPTVMEFRAEVASIEGNIGQLLCNIGKTDDALDLFRSALSIQQKLVHDYPAAPDHKRFLANTNDGISTVMAAKGKPAEALKVQEAALEIRRKLAIEHPQSPEVLSELANSLNNMAANYADSKRFREARESLRLAVASQRKAMELDPANPTFRQLLIDELNDLIKLARTLGDSREAAEVARELAALRNSAPVIAALDARLAAIIKGTQEPRDEADRLRLAQRAYDKAFHATAARLRCEAVVANPRLADDRRAQYRYNAACSAALASCGHSKDDPPLDDDARAKLRRQALDWLKAELSAWKRVAMTVAPGNKEAVAKTLKNWKANAELAGLRDAEAQAKLPEEERDAFRRLWADVDALLAKAEVS